MVLALQNGEVDVCANFLSASSVTQLQNNPEYLIESVPSLGYALISFSQTNELLTDVKVRQAIAMSVNRDALVNVAFAGAATAMETPISPVYTEFTKANSTCCRRDSVSGRRRERCWRKPAIRIRTETVSVKPPTERS